MKKSDKNSKNVILINELETNPLKHSYLACGMKFTVPKKYELIKIIGEGAYGVVLSAKNKDTGEMVAIKKIPNAFLNLIDAKRIIREIKLLQFFQHENIISLYEIIEPDDPKNFEDIYIVTDLMGTDLHKTIHSSQILTKEHIQYFMYQILKGVLYIHSSGIIHRDLKPSNILLSQNCDLKICDFGLSRGLDYNVELTEYVVTRWYRAPEIILNANEYGKPVDIWSIGCIMAEILGRKPFLRGNDFMDQMKKIIEKTGTPSKEDIEQIESEEGKKFILELPFSPQPNWNKVFPNCCKEGLDLLSKMLLFNPKKRIKIEECLRHPYFTGLYNKEDEITISTTFDWKWDNFKP